MYLPDVSADGTATTDRRTRRRQEGRDRVYHAAISLFIARGFDNTTMDDIAERADVARATVFNYFQRKTAFLDEWAARRRQHALSALRAEHVSERPLPEILARYMLELAKMSVETREETIALMRVAVHSTDILANPYLAGELAGFVARAQVSGEVRTDVDPEQAGLVVAVTYFAILTRWVSDDAVPFDLAGKLLEAVNLICGGLLPRAPVAVAPPDAPAR